MTFNPIEVLSTIERAARAGERVPAPLVLWAVRFGFDHREQASVMRSLLGTLVIEYPGRAPAWIRAMESYDQTAQHYGDPTQQSPKVSNLPKAQGELWEGVATKMASALLNLVEQDQVAATTDPLLIAALAALNGYNSLAAQPLVGYDRDDDEVVDDDQGNCRICSGIGKVPAPRCPACRRDVEAPSTRIGMPEDLRPLGVYAASPRVRAVLTEHELDAFTAGYWFATDRYRVQGFPELLIKVWDDWAGELCSPTQLGEAVDDGPVGPSESIEPTADDGQVLPFIPVIFHALRNEAGDAFLVARLKPGAVVARLRDVEYVVCEIRTTPGDDEIMLRDFRAAEAFSAFLTAFPALATLVDDMDMVMDPAQWMQDGIEATGE